MVVTDVGAVMAESEEEEVVAATAVAESEEEAVAVDSQWTLEGFAFGVLTCDTSSRVVPNVRIFNLAVQPQQNYCTRKVHQALWHTHDLSS